MTAQLNAREEFTANTQQAKHRNKGQGEYVCEHVAPLTVDRLVMPIAQTHEPDPGDVNCNDRGTRETAPQNIERGPLVLYHLTNRNPAKNGERHAR